MATHSSILAWRNPWTDFLADYNPWGGKESDTTEHVHVCMCTHTHTHMMRMVLVMSCILREEVGKWMIFL